MGEGLPYTDALRLLKDEDEEIDEFQQPFLSTSGRLWNLFRYPSQGGAMSREHVLMYLERILPWPEV